MKLHTETLVKIRAYKADLADRLINAWGTEKFFMVIDDLVRNHKAFAATMAEAVIAIKADHLNQFPKVVPFSFDNLPVELSTDPNFKNIRERFPHIGKQIATDWGTKGGLDYLEKLMVDDRHGKRQGFPLEIYQSLMKLLELHNLTFPSLKQANTDPWDLV
jgi:hypothetical protein